jgi:hypothetical protein
MRKASKNRAVEVRSVRREPAASTRAIHRPGTRHPMLVHCVYFWFKPDADPAILAAFESGLRRLTTIPEVATAYFGRPEATPKRAVIDDTYAWALVETFTDLAAHDRYQEHAIHQQFLSDFSASWERVQVYDLRTSDG